MVSPDQEADDGDTNRRQRDGSVAEMALRRERAIRSDTTPKPGIMM